MKPTPAPLLVDRRTGSAELLLPLQARQIPVELCTLRFGDLAIVGNGDTGPVMIGVERKRVRDLLQSLTSGRLSGHQLPGLVDEYAHRWVLVEGAYRESDDGLIEVPRGHGRPWELIRFKYAALEAYLLTLVLRAGVHMHRTYSVDETVAWLGVLWHWWTGKTWQEHRSHLALHRPPDIAIWCKPGLVQRWAAELPGIDSKSVDVAKHFKTPLELAVAGEDQWRKIAGIGKTTAARVVQLIQQGD